jgi:hypothetical protein
MSDIATLVNKLTKEELAQLRQLVFADMANESQVSDTPGMVMVYNRSPKAFEFQWDSRVYTIEGHKFAVFEEGVARHAVKKGQYLHIGTPDVKEWIVPKGSLEFGIPMATDGLTGDPVKDYPIDLVATDIDPLPEPGQHAVFKMDKLPPPGPNEPRPLAKKGSADNAIGFSETAHIAGAVKV